MLWYNLIKNHFVDKWLLWRYFLINFIRNSKTRLNIIHLRSLKLVWLWWLLFKLTRPLLSIRFLVLIRTRIALFFKLIKFTLFVLFPIRPFRLLLLRFPHSSISKIFSLIFNLSPSWSESLWSLTFALHLRVAAIWIHFVLWDLLSRILLYWTLLVIGVIWGIWLLLRHSSVRIIIPTITLPLFTDTSL